MISIVSLIYKSPRYADSVFDSLMENTEELRDGRAEFFFVANGASREVIEHLDDRMLMYVVNNPEHVYDADLANRGLAPPAYMTQVYSGWNVAIENAADTVVLVNSDHVFTPGWLTELMARWNKYTVLSPLTVEPGPNPFPPHINGTGAVQVDCGRHPDGFDKQKFLSVRGYHNLMSDGGAYMPCVFSREMAQKAGCYPEGNPVGDYGDRVFFRELCHLGVKHTTVHDSVVYHFHEGEMRE